MEDEVTCPTKALVVAISNADVMNKVNANAITDMTFLIRFMKGLPDEYTDNEANS